jgi:hypothetical protein
MVDRRMGLGQAMSASYHRVVDNGFWEHLALIVVFFAVSAIANGWVGIITTPFTIAVIVGAYFATHDYDRQYLELATVAVPAGPPPAAPAQTTLPAAPASPAAPAVEAAATQANADEAETVETDAVDADAGEDTTKPKA